MEARDVSLRALVNDRQTFDARIRALSAVELAGLFPEVLRALDDAPMAEADRDSRFKRIWHKASSEITDLVPVAETARALSSSILRNAVTDALPPNIRRLVFSRSRTPPDRPLGPLHDSKPAEMSSAATVTATAAELSTNSDVLILTLSDAEPTRRLLESRGFAMHRVTSIEEFETMLKLNSSICAFIVERSFLEVLDTDKQKILIKSLATYSTFVFLWLSGAGLKVAQYNVGTLVARCRCSTRQPDYLRLKISDGDAIQAADLDYIDRSRAKLDVSALKSFFLPSDVDDAELHLLAAALAEDATRRHFTGNFEIQSIRARFLHDGQSGARVALVRLNDNTFPAVVKLDKKAQIVAEAERFLTFILPHLPEHEPSVHFHHDAGLIVFDVIGASEMSDMNPAPTLGAQLSALWYDEMAGRHSATAHDSVLRAFSQATARLQVINSSTPAAGFISKANPYVKGVKEMEARGFNWGFDDSVLAAREAAEALIESTRLSAICHGDAHTRNVLIRRDQGYLIDYAYSGPGHPATDLARLELSVFLTSLHPFGSPSMWEALQYDLTATNATADQLLLKHEALSASALNQTCIRMCVQARDACLNVLTRRGIDRTQYTAIKLLLK